MLYAARGHGLQLATEGAGAVAEEVERLWRVNGWRTRRRRRVVPQFANRRRDRLSPFAGLKQRAEDRIGRRRGICGARREYHRDRREGANFRKSREIGGIVTRLGRRSGTREGHACRRVADRRNGGARRL